MKDTLHDTLRAQGGLVRTSRLLETGYSRREISAAIRDGWLLRPVRPWVATREAERDAVLAVLHRGSLTGASALGSYGVWRGVDRSIHVLVAPNCPGTVATSSVPLGTFAGPAILTGGVVRHWGRAMAPVAAHPEWRVSIVDALAMFATSETPEFLVAAIDNALHEQKLRASELPVLFDILPLRLQSLITQVDGRAEAGTESLVRLRCKLIARRVDIQVKIGPYRADILIDGWLVLEVMSEEWHASTRIEDSQKATWLTAHGFRVEHFDYFEVMNEWEKCAAAIAEILRHSRHGNPEQPTRHRASREPPLLRAVDRGRRR